MTLAAISLAFAAFALAGAIAFFIFSVRAMHAWHFGDRVDAAVMSGICVAISLFLAALLLAYLDVLGKLA
jgi:hypothetical protein